MSEAKITITAEDQTRSAIASVSAGLEKLTLTAERVKSGLEAIGVAYAVEKGVEFVSTALEGAAALEELSQRTGITAEGLSQLQYAAKLSSVSTDSLTAAMKKLQVSMSSAEAGDQLKIAAFKQLGITQADLGKGTESVMLKMADAYAHAQDGAGKTALSITLMGKAGDEMVPFLNKGSSAIRQMADEADALGLTISTEFAEKANAFETNMARIRAASQTTAILIAGNLVDSLNKATTAFIENAKEGSKFLGVLQAYRAFFTGDDLHKANVQLTEDTDKLLRAQDDLARLKSQGYADDSMAVVQKKQQIEQLQSEISTTMNYRRELEGEKDAKNDAADAAKRAREEGTKLEAQSKASLAATQKEAEEYRTLKQALDQRIATQAQQLALGRPLQESEKIEIEFTTKLNSAKVTLTAAHRAELEARKDKAVQQAKDIQLQQLEIKAYEETIAAYEQLQSDRAKAIVDQSNVDQKFSLATSNELRALQDTNAQLQLEAQLIAATDSQRGAAIEKLKIEQQLQQKILEITQNVSPALRQVEIDRATDAANEAKRQVQFRADLQDQLQLVTELDGLGHKLWDDLWARGHGTLQKLGADIETYLVDELFKLVEKQWIIPIYAQVTGAGGVGQTLSSGAAAFTGNSGLLSGLPGMGSLFGGGAAASGGWVGTEAMGTGSGVLGAVDSQAANVALGLTAEDVASTTIPSVALGAGAGALGAIGAALPYVGLALVAGQALGLFGSSHGPKTESGVSSGFGDVAQRGDPTAANSIIAGIQSLFAGAAGAIGLKTTALPVGAFVSQDPNGTALTQLQIQSANYNRGTEYGGIENVGRSDAQLQAAELRGELEDVFTELKAEIGKEGLTGQLADLVKSIDPATASVDDMSAALKKLQDVGSFDQAVGALGSEFSNLTSLTVDAKEALIAGAGGLQNFTTELTAFNNDFTTAAEKQDATWKSLVATFTAANVVLPSTRDAFRQAVDTATAIGDVKSLQTLLGAEQAFNQLYPAIDSTAAAASGATKAMDDWQTAYFKSWASTGDAATKSAQATSAAWGEVFSGMRDSFGALMGSISDKVAQIRGDLVSNPVGVSLASAQANFNSLIAQVSAGGSGSMAAARQLGDASTLLLNVAQNSGMEALPLSLLKAKTAQALANVQPAIGRQNAADSKSVALAYWNSTGGDAGSAYASPRAGAGGSGFSDASVVHIREMSRRLSDLHSVMSRQQEMLGDLLNGRQRAPLSVTVV